MTAACVPLRHAADVLVSNVDKKSVDGEPAVRLVNYTDVYYSAAVTPAMDLMRATATPDQVRKFRLRPGDTLITKDSETPEDIAIATFIEASEPDMVCGYHLALLRPRPEFVPKYLHWAIVSDRSRGQFSVAANGMTRYGLTHDAIQSVAVPHLPMEEQRRIAAFLDDQTTRIDQIITARQQQIGLVADAHMAEIDAGLAGLAGEYGWTTLRRRLTRIQQGWSPDCDQFPAGDNEWGVLKVGAVKRGAFRAQENKRLPSTLEPRLDLRVRPGDVLFTRANTRDLVGDCCVVPGDVPSSLLLCDKIMRVVLDSRTVPHYVALAALGSRSRAHFSQLASGTSGSMVNIRGEDIQDMPLPDASLQAQQTSVEDLSEARSNADMRRDLLQVSMALLREFKRSLISAAVSGEFDVSSASGRGVPS